MLTKKQLLSNCKTFENPHHKCSVFSTETPDIPINNVINDLFLSSVKAMILFLRMLTKGITKNHTRIIMAGQWIKGNDDCRLQIQPELRENK